MSKQDTEKRYFELTHQLKAARVHMGEKRRELRDAEETVESLQHQVTNLKADLYGGPI